MNTTHSHKNPENRGRSAAGNLSKEATDETRSASTGALAEPQSGTGADLPLQKKANHTGMPDNLKSGLENLSGHSMDDVRVHYDSPRPAQLQAHAYAQGTDIHLAPGQQKHLPHEAWHVVQQKQGRVKPTLQAKQLPGVAINDDAGLEKESDIMGDRAAQMKPDTDARPQLSFVHSHPSTIQRKVLVKGTPATLIDKGTALVNKTPVQTGSEKSGWVTDGYARHYDSIDEFRKHVQGQPVDVGLAKKPGVWYRLPFFSRNRFFVLGENHGVFGYRELIRESNQTGKVLGEGGSNTLMSATPGGGLEAEPKGLMHPDTGAPQEFIMENLAAKAYFALVHMRNQFGKAAPAAKKTEPESDWLSHYQGVDPGKRGKEAGFTPLPYYEDPMGEKVFASTGSKAENYDSGNTADRIIIKLGDALNAYNGAPNHRVDAARVAVQTFLQTVPRTLVSLNLLINSDALKNLAFTEATKMKGGDPKQDLLDRLKVVKKNQSKWDKDLQISMAHRDYAMYQSVLKAAGDHFVMAGMGDHHAKNIKDDLVRQGIPVVLFGEFLAPPYTEDALTPMAETPGFTDKQDQAESERDGFLKQLTQILKGPGDPDPRELSHALVPFAQPRASGSPLHINPDILNLLRNTPLHEPIDPLLARLMKEVMQSHGKKPPVGNGKPLAIKAPEQEPEEARPETKARKATPKYLAQMRKALADLYILPRGALDRQPGQGGILLQDAPHAQGISMGMVFDQFMWLVDKTGSPDMVFSGSLNDCLTQLREAYHRSSGFVLQSQSDTESMFLHLALLFHITGLGQLSLKDLLTYVSLHRNREAAAQE